MSESIKKKALRGVAWSAVEKFLRQGLMTLFSILIARQLSPSDYGLVAMLTIFLVVAQVFVDSGFVEALIGGIIGMDGLDICYQCVPYGATSEIEYSDGFS